MQRLRSSKPTNMELDRLHFICNTPGCPRPTFMVLGVRDGRVATCPSCETSYQVRMAVGHDRVLKVRTVRVKTKKKPDTHATGPSDEP